MTKQYKRTEVYSKTAMSEPKYMFVWLCDKLKTNMNSPGVILDVGAASGDFLSYASSRFSHAKCLGVEYDPELVALGNRRAEHFDLQVGDANDLKNIATASCDAVFLTGTHSIFDDFRPSFNACLRVVRPGGYVLITGLFNDHPLDARIQWRYPERFEEDWHPGYNLFSKKSISKFLSDCGSVENYSFEKFSLPFDLQQQDDPVRSWTEKSISGARTFRNGIMPLNLELLLISTKVVP